MTRSTSVCVGIALAVAAGCDPDGPSVATDGGLGDTTTDAMTDASTSLPATFFPPQAPAFGPRTDAPRSVQISVSAEDVVESGYIYDPNPGPSDAVFVDGWSLTFEHYFVVIHSARLNGSPSDPSMRGVVGPLVAEARGPWLVDLRRPGPLVGAAGSPETAWPLDVLPGPFDPSTMYAFSYETAPASASMRNVNVPESDRTWVERMLARRWSILVAGTATYEGRAATETVDSTFRPYPTEVHFEFGWSMPTRYVNCHNPEIGEADEPANRGIRPSATGAQRAQLTFHTDHFFWDQADVEGTPLRFDAFAARSSRFGMTGGMYSVSMEDLAGVPPSALVDRAGNPVRDRGNQTTGYMAGAGSPPAYLVNTASEITDLRSFAAYNARAQGHLNSDGLCLVEPSAPIGY